MSAWPEIERADVFREPTLTATERQSMDAWLNFHRATLLHKCAGLRADHLVLRSCPPSRLSLLGLVRHMTGVEGWFHAFDGRPEHSGYWSPDAPNASFEALDPTTADADLAAYHASVERAERAVAALDLDALCPCDECADEPRSLRWVYTHMIEEYARHNGHADLIREAIDGAVGD